ncbi:hypothetical protein ACS0TY_007920 [Phlomoides rotata]
MFKQKRIQFILVIFTQKIKNIALSPTLSQYFHKSVNASVSDGFKWVDLWNSLRETSGGLKSSRNTSVGEQVAIRTVSKYLHIVLNAIIKLHPKLLARPDTIGDGYTDNRWRFFKNCLGALDGSYVNVSVPRYDQSRYRNRKGHILVNVQVVCDINMNFVYVLTGWEGSVNDSRVLRDVVTNNPGFRVPIGLMLMYLTLVEDSRTSSGTNIRWEARLHFSNVKLINHCRNPTELHSKVPQVQRPCHTGLHLHLLGLLRLHQPQEIIRLLQLDR